MNMTSLCPAALFLPPFLRSFFVYVLGSCSRINILGLADRLYFYQLLEKTLTARKLPSSGLTRSFSFLKGSQSSHRIGVNHK